MKDKENTNYDKCGKMRWLMETISKQCEYIWDLHEHVTIDEMMVKCKGKYGPNKEIHARQTHKMGYKSIVCQ